MIGRYDLILKENIEVEAGKSLVIKTGLKFDVPAGKSLLILGDDNTQDNGLLLHPFVVVYGYVQEIFLNLSNISNQHASMRKHDAYANIYVMDKEDIVHFELKGRE